MCPPRVRAPGLPTGSASCPAPVLSAPCPFTRQPAAPQEQMPSCPGSARGGCARTAVAHGSGTAVGLCTTAPDNGLLSFHKARHELAYEVSRSSTPGDVRRRNECSCHNNNENNKKRAGMFIGALRFLAPNRKLPERVDVGKWVKRPHTLPRGDGRGDGGKEPAPCRRLSQMLGCAQGPRRTRVHAVPVHLWEACEWARLTVGFLQLL